MDRILTYLSDCVSYEQTVIAFQLSMRRGAFVTLDLAPISNLYLKFDFNLKITFLEAIKMSVNGT